MYRYLLEPWTNPELATCNPHGSYRLTTLCSVTGSESSFTLEWYYSNSSSNAGRNSDNINNIGENYFVQTLVEDELENGAFRTLSQLTIINVTVNNFGYYWCMVRLRNSGTLLPNPSTILHLSNVCPSGPVCNSSIRLYYQWPNDSCANHDNNNITLPEMLQCNRTTSTSDNVASIRPSRTAHPMDSSATLPFQTITGKRGGDVVRPSGSEDKVKTSIKLPSPRSTVVYTEPLPTVMVSDSDSDTQLNWLYVGIAMAIVLTAVAVILILIICMHYKKWKVKGKYMKL